jgi:glycosyltransferase involved in cell wall biosynthesis
MKVPMISVFMITYNHEKYIHQALDSVLVQKTTYNYEIVIGEDASTDNTRKILLEYQALYPERIRLILHEKNVGAMTNQYMTLQACRGKYIAILEGDDFWVDTHKLQKQASLMEQDSSVVLCGGQAHILWPGQTMGAIGEYPLEIKTEYDFTDVVLANPFSTCTVMFRPHPMLDLQKEHLDSPVGDWLIYILIGLNNQSVRYIEVKNVLSCYRIHDQGIFTSLSLKRSLQKKIQTLKIIQTIAGDGYHFLHLPETLVDLNLTLAGEKLAGLRNQLSNASPIRVTENKLAVLHAYNGLLIRNLSESRNFLMFSLRISRLFKKLLKNQAPAYLLDFLYYKWDLLKWIYPISLFGWLVLSFQRVFYYKNLKFRDVPYLVRQSRKMAKISRVK